MRVDDSGFHSFSTITNLHVFKSGDDPDEIFYLYHPDDMLNLFPEKTIYNLKRGCRFLERLYMSGVPFIVILYDEDVESHHMGWNVYLPHIENWIDVLETDAFGVTAMNQSAYDFLVNENSKDSSAAEGLKKEDNSMYDLDVSKFYVWHQESNIHLFFMRSK